MAYLFWIILGVFIAYLLPVAWHEKFHNWFIIKMRKKVKPKIIKKDDINDEVVSKKKIAKEINITDETTEL